MNDPGFSPREATATFGLGASLRLLGAARIRTAPCAWDVLRERRGAVRGIVLTHLHVDHTSGLTELCDGGARLPTPAPLWLSPEQRTTSHDMERAELAKLDALAAAGGRCIDLHELPG